jgi:hypothetical protein
LPNSGFVGRFASAIAFVAMLVFVLGSAGCDQRFENRGGSGVGMSLASTLKPLGAPDE